MHFDKTELIEALMVKSNLGKIICFRGMYGISKENVK